MERTQSPSVRLQLQPLSDQALIDSPPLAVLLERLGNEQGTLALILNKAQNRFQDPAKLRRVIVDLINEED